MVATLKRFAERMVVRGKVDREQGVIYDVQLLGPKSKNGRRYTRTAMEEAVSKYEGLKIYVDHPENMGADRKWNDWAGIVENARFSGGTIRGDIRLRKKSPKFEELIEAAEEFSEFFGMSHVAEGPTRLERGEEVIEEIQAVHSVDIVQQPATASGLRENFSESTGNLGDQGWGTLIRKMIHLNQRHNILLPVDEAIEVAALWAAKMPPGGPYAGESMEDKIVRQTHDSVSETGDGPAGEMSDGFRAGLCSESLVPRKRTDAELREFVRSLGGSDFNYPQG